MAGLLQNDAHWNNCSFTFSKIFCKLKMPCYRQNVWMKFWKRNKNNNIADWWCRRECHVIDEQQRTKTSIVAVKDKKKKGQLHLIAGNANMVHLVKIKEYCVLFDVMCREPDILNFTLNHINDRKTCLQVCVTFNKMLALCSSSTHYYTVYIHLFVCLCHYWQVLPILGQNVYTMNVWNSSVCNTDSSVLTALCRNVRLSNLSSENCGRFSPTERSRALCCSVSLLWARHNAVIVISLDVFMACSFRLTVQTNKKKPCEVSLGSLCCSGDSMTLLLNQVLVQSCLNRSTWHQKRWLILVELIRPPNRRWHRWRQNAQFPSNHVVEQHGAKPSRCSPQSVDGPEPGSLVDVQPEPRVSVRALKLWQDRRRVHHGVTKVEVPQNGGEDGEVQFGIIDLRWEDEV